MNSQIKTVIVGQGPNQTAWKHGLDLGVMSLAADPRTAVNYPDAAARWAAAERYAENYCRRVSITGTTGRKLAELAGCDLREREELRFYLRHDRENLNARWTGKTGKGDNFDMAEAKTRALEIEARGYAKAVLLGKNVAAAFGLKGEVLTVLKVFKSDPFAGKTSDLGTKTKAGEVFTEFLLFPHPSGITAWWNEKFNRYRAAKALRDFLQ